MSAFEFVILFFSFIYTLALTHLFFAWTRMIRIAANSLSLGHTCCGCSPQDWAKGNWLVLLAFPFILLALFVRRPWAQIASPAVELALTIAFAVIYYPALHT